jgi:hypothetical protein
MYWYLFRHIICLSNGSKLNSSAYHLIYYHKFIVVTTSDTKMSLVRGSVTNNNGFRIGWFDLLALQLQFLRQLTINDCLRLARSIPHGTTSVFSSAWLTWFWFMSQSLLQLPLSLVNTPQLNTELSCDQRLNYDWINLLCIPVFIV